MSVSRPGNGRELRVREEEAPRAADRHLFLVSFNISGSGGRKERHGEPCRSHYGKREITMD